MIPRYSNRMKSGFVCLIMGERDTREKLRLEHARYGKPRDGRVHESVILVLALSAILVVLMSVILWLHLHGAKS